MDASKDFKVGRSRDSSVVLRAEEVLTDYLPVSRASKQTPGTPLRLEVTCSRSHRKGVKSQVRSMRHRCTVHSCLLPTTLRKPKSTGGKIKDFSQQQFLKARLMDLNCYW